MDGEQIPWIDWINEIVAAAEELKEAGMPLDLDPSEDLQVLHNMIAISAAEWRKGNQVDLDGPGMGKAIGDEKSYSPAQIYEQTWGKDTSDVDVTVVNNKFEFLNCMQGAGRLTCAKTAATFHFPRFYLAHFGQTISTTYIWRLTTGISFC